jgi:hypothetical protein
MQIPALAVNLALAAIAVAMFAFGAATFYSLVVGALELRRRLRSVSQDLTGLLLKSPIVPGVSVVYTTASAGPQTRALVRRLLDLHYAESELVLVLDGASDSVRLQWVEELHLVPAERSAPAGLARERIRGFYVSQDPLRLLVVDKAAAGEPDALNAGIDAARYPVIAFIDAEADFVPEVLLFLIRPMLQDWESITGACAVSPAPGTASLPGRIGTVETLRVFLVRGAAFSAWKRLLPLPGSCMLVKRDALIAAGGFRGGTPELFLDLYAAPGARIAFVPMPVSCRPAAASWKDLHRQTSRDQSLLTAAMRHRGPGAGRKSGGLFGVRVVRPLLETAGLFLAAAGLLAGIVRPGMAALYLLAGAGMGVALSMAAVVLRELIQPAGHSPHALIALFFASIPENLGYRQLRNLWLIRAFFQTETRANGMAPRARVDLF